MFLVCVVCLALQAQQPDTRAADLRALIAATPRLALGQAALVPGLPMGTVSSVAVGSDGVIYILQRGDKADPVIAINRDGRVLRSWGRGMFTVPHGIRVDGDGNIWTVDAGSSMVLKFSPEGKKLAEIAVGEVATGKNCAFPTLCGTTDIAFGPGGRLFISDGYGNARILEYNAAGQRVRVWGQPGSGPGQFQIPHGIATDGQVIYVADRGNARIQRFDLDGHYLGEWTHLGRPFALKLSGGALWISLMTLEPTGASPWMIKVDSASGKPLGQIEFPGPHSIDVDAAQGLYAGGCCGGSNPTTVFLPRAR